MLIRYASLVLSICLLSSPPAWAEKKLNYLSEIIDLVELIPPPPPIGTEAYTRDLAGVIELQETRTKPQIEAALADNVLSIYRFSDVLGPKFKQENLPLLHAFIARAQVDTRATLMATKNIIQRKRPALASKDVAPLGGRPRLPTGYPSGGTVFTTVTSIILSKMVPEKRYELAERNLKYAFHRVVLGQHYPRDVQAGATSGAVIAFALMQNPAFNRDLSEASAELRKVLGYPAAVKSDGPAQPK